MATMENDIENIDNQPTTFNEVSIFIPERPDNTLEAPENGNLRNDITPSIPEMPSIPYMNSLIVDQQIQIDGLKEQIANIIISIESWVPRIQQLEEQTDTNTLRIQNLYITVAENTSQIEFNTGDIANNGTRITTHYSNYPVPP